MSQPSLNEPQMAAVTHEGGPLVVFAGAGSGKTRVITHRIAHLVENAGVPAYKILAVTFTNKAAGEMRERLLHILPGGVRDLWVGTFHSVCARILRRYADVCGISSNFVVYDDDDSRAAVLRAMRDLNIDEKRIDAKRVRSFIDRAKNEVKGPGDVDANDYFADAAKRIYEAYENKLRMADALDFGDLIYRLVVSLEANDDFRNELSRRYSHILVDEFQDTNHAQLRLIRALASTHRNITVVGDDDQSIYRWRGADRRNILEFRTWFEDTQVVKLEQNYRSTKRILAAANAIIRRNVSREPKTLWTDNGEGSLVRVVCAFDERDEAQHVVNTIREHRDRVGLRGIAVLYRIHAQSRVLEEALRAANIRYQIVGGMRFYERAEVKDVLAYLRIAQNPNDDVSLQRVINTPSRGIGKTTMDRILDTAAQRGVSVWTVITDESVIDALGTAARKSIRAFTSLVDDIRHAAKEGAGPESLADTVLTRSGYLDMLKDEDSPEADARLENIKELVGSMADFENEAEEPTLARFLELITLQSATDGMNDEETVTLMTVHAAKGLEYPVVMVTGLEEEMFPYRGIDPSADPDELEEERRLAYVAFTRAREQLVLMWAPSRRVFGQPRIAMRSRFLDEIPVECIDARGRAPQPRYPSVRDDDGDSSYTVPEGGMNRPAWQHPQSRSGRPSASSNAHSGRFMGSPAASSSSRGPGGRSSAPPPPDRAPGESYVDRSEGDDAEGGTLRRGMRVRHAKYGVGTIETWSDGVPPKVTVSFVQYGTKQIVATYLSPV